jgi:predicted metalloprotease with PDZ domain
MQIEGSILPLEPAPLNRGNHQLPRRRVRLGLMALALMAGTAIGVWRAVEAARPAHPTEFKYQVRVLDPEQARLEVDLTLSDLAPGVLELGFSANAVAATAPASKYRVREALGPEGATSLIEKTGFGWAIPHGAGDLRIRYEVSLRAGRNGKAFADEALSAMDRTGGRILGSDLFLFPLDVPARTVTVDWELPAGWELENPYRVSPERLAPPNLRALYGTATAVGEHRVVHRRLGGYEISVAIRGNFRFGDDALAENILDVVEHQIGFFGRAPDRHYLFIVEPHPHADDPEQLHYFGLHFNASMILLLDPRSAAQRLEKEPAALCAHEFLHSWIGELVRQEGYDMNWFVEGVASLYADRTLLATRKLDYGTWTERMRRAWEEDWRDSPLRRSTSLARAGEIVLQNAEYTSLLYTGGPLLALALDLEIQERTHHRHSLDDLLRALSDRAFADPRFRLTRASLLAQLQALTGTDFADWLDRHAWGTAELPLPGSIAAG